MGNSGASVAFDRDFDWVDHETGERHVEELEQVAVHTLQVQSFQHQSNYTRHLWACTGVVDYCGGDVEAKSIIKMAKQMAAMTAAEEREVFNNQWSGPGGQDALFMLYETTDLEEIAERLESLCGMVTNSLEEEPTVVRVVHPAKVYGDIHGQFRDMLLLLHDFGWPHTSPLLPRFIFNGDWVDRGRHQLEVISLVLAFKARFPHKVVLLRGNHEDEVQNSHMGQKGFVEACRTRFGPELGMRVNAAVNEVFHWLPLACLIDESILVLHGGIGDGRWDIDDHLDEVERPLNHDQLADNLMVYNVLWSDPIPEEQPVKGVHDSPRDDHAHKIKTYGEDITLDFCERNCVDCIIRSHQVIQGGCGYELMHQGHCMRVFSARDYEGMNNDAAILQIRYKAHRGELVVRPQVLKSLTRSQRAR